MDSLAPEKKRGDFGRERGISKFSRHLEKISKKSECETPPRREKASGAKIKR